MKLVLVRTFSEWDFTLGNLWIDGEPECFTLEDEGRAKKVFGETRIPAGLYPIKFREIITEKTERYRDKYPWFKWHIQLQDVPNFEYVYIHVGNDDDDTDGCILVGKQQERGKIMNSAVAFKDLYSKVSSALVNQEEVTIRIYDMLQLPNEWKI